MIFNLTGQEIFFIIFFILAAVVIWTCLDIIKLLRRERREPFLPEGFTKDELFLRISEDFKKQLEKLIEKEIQKNIEEFKNTLQKTSEEIIKNYKSQFASGNQEIQRQISNLTKFTLEAQSKIAEESKNKIEELNRAAEKELAGIQEVNLKASEVLSKDLAQKFAKVYQSVQDSLGKKVVETEKEIENYKKERLKEIDQKIYQMLGEVAKKTIGKAIDLSEHEKLVMEALEKAKKEIF